MNLDAPRSLTELAAALGVNYRRVLRLRQDGVLIQNADGVFDMDATRAALEEAAGRRPWSSLPRDPVMAEYEARDLKAKAMTREANLGRMLGKLVVKEDVVQAWVQRLIELKRALKNMGRELTPLLIGKSPGEMQAIIDEYARSLPQRLKDPTYVPRNVT